MGSRWGAARAGAAGAGQGPGRDTTRWLGPAPGGSCRGKGLRHPGTPHLGPRLPPHNPPASEPHRAGFKASSTFSKCGRAAELTGPVTRHREHREAWPPPPSAGTSTGTRAQDTTGAQLFPQQHHRSDPFSRIRKKSRFRGVAGLPGHKLCPLCGRVPLSWFPPHPAVSQLNCPFLWDVLPRTKACDQGITGPRGSRGHHTQTQSTSGPTGGAWARVEKAIKPRGVATEQ